MRHAIQCEDFDPTQGHTLHFVEQIHGAELITTLNWNGVIKIAS